MKDQKAPAALPPIIRANGRDVDLIFGLHAAGQELRRAEKEAEKRIRAIPNGWRDLRLIITKLDKLLDGLHLTVQPEKRQTMQRMAPRMRFRVWCGQEAVKTAPNEVVITKNEMGTLLTYAWEGTCTLCIEQRCDRCPLGKTLDSVLSVDRNRGSWAAFDPKNID